jgi:thioredoxin-dependent peroxiredoxin
MVTLDELLAYGRLLLAFYVEDGTPSCETEVTMLRDAFETLREARVGVLALSADSLSSHEAFAARLGGLPFPLASDVAVEIARAYGVVDEAEPKRSRRAMFVVDRDGTVLLALPRFQPNNIAEVEAIFASLGLGGETPR